GDRNLVARNRSNMVCKSTINESMGCSKVQRCQRADHLQATKPSYSHPSRSCAAPVLFNPNSSNRRLIRRQTSTGVLRVLNRISLILENNPRLSLTRQVN